MNILRILVSAVIETIRHLHAKAALEYYKKQGWIDPDCESASRPPEIRQVIELKNRGIKKICYPEPSLYSEEADWVDHFEVEAFTPLWSKDQDGALGGLRVGVSISEYPIFSYSTHHLHADHLMRLSQDMARHLLARSGKIIYGGDLRKDGFTQFLLDEAVALKSRLNSCSINIENNLAWPLYLSDPEVTAWRAKYCGIIESVEHRVPSDVAVDVDEGVFLPPTGIENRYIWSRSLTAMRESLVDSSDVRICAGGKLSGYLGKMPGVLEEIVITLTKDKPIFLLGAFGGVVQVVCEVIREKEIDLSITEQWQISNNSGYFDLQGKAKTHDNNADYGKICDLLISCSVEKLAANAGLDVEDYLRLMQSPFIDECVHLVLKGLQQLKSNQGYGGKSRTSIHSAIGSLDSQ